MSNKACDQSAIMNPRLGTFRGYQFEYLGVTTVRGITVDHWQSCQTWPQVASTFTLDYYFTASNWTDPLGQGVQPVPVRAVANGTQTFKGAVTGRSFLHYYDFVDFQPSIPEDTTIFETPKGVVCVGRKGLLPIPELPRFYHYRQEILVAGHSEIYHADVWYDRDSQYIRYDYRQLVPSPPLNTTNPVTEVHDFNFGVRYLKNQVTGQCVTDAITNTTFDVGEKTSLLVNGSQIYALHMKDPMALFYLDSNYSYTGMRPARGIMCKVFTAVRNDYNVPGFGRQMAVFEYYFLNDNSYEVPDDGDTMPRGVPVSLEVAVKQLGLKVSYNFLDFDESHPDISLFDVSACYSESAKLQFQVRFPGAYKTGTSVELLTEAASLLRAAASVDPIRLQDVRFDYDNSQIYVYATLLDRTPPQAQFTLLSNKEIEKQDDQSYGSNVVHNVSECARSCVNYGGFTCESFDFCPMDPAGVCRLSRSHIGDGGITVVNSTCDHFSRTVLTPGANELSLVETFALIQNSVYNGQLTIYINIPGLENPYTAVEVRVTFGYLMPRPLPTLSGQFSYHLEITVPRYTGVINSHIFYDSDFRLVRYDLVNTQPMPPLYTSDPISTIHDYSSGLSYTLDKAQGNCTIAPITNTSFDEGTGNAGYVVKMKSPLELFYLNGSYIYAGQKTVRGIFCDVFEATRSDFKYGKDTVTEPAVFQFFFMSSDWHELSEDSGTAVRSQPIALTISAISGSYTLTYDFYDFSEQHPDLRNFDIRPCFVGKQLRHFLIKFRGNYHPTLDRNLKQFTKNTQQMLSFYTSASFLRFQDPSITYTDDGYVYYLATMVEQAPYLLDFTKTPNQVSVYSADQIISGVNSEYACASFCRNSTKIDCEGFDYCPSARRCQLKTVDSVAPIEPSVDEAFIIIKDVVYTRGFNVSVHDDVNAQTVVYHAVLFDEDILRPDSTATTSVNLQHFIPARHRVLINTPVVTLKGVSVDQCAARCLGEATFDCQSFDYCFDTGGCTMSDQHADRGLAVTATRALCDLYSRSYLDSYDAYPGQTLELPGAITITDVSSVNFCAEKCSKSTVNTTGVVCKSFDYCSGSNTCILKAKHVLDMPKSALHTSATCSHFSRKYINDFDKTPGRQFSTYEQIVSSNVSKDACAKLCVENSDATCQAFSYCQNSGLCVITGLSPRLNRANISSNTSCDLYTRRYFPVDSSGKGPTTGQQKGSSGSHGYTGGAMAGLALGMLIPGMVLGAALLYFMRTKRLVREEQLRMGFMDGSSRRRAEDMEHIKEPEDALPPHIPSYDTPH
ncbi:hypothetical protein MAR_036570 [Mya arenaria]|uniref:Apple domain-containing protein n=1 Tax=Mya arenaria TaxID=6604 RepID=A0ABY7FUM1_MYAAR|nr:hypothetical protein MAR_036570 [Mya arenaria]